MRMDLHIHSCLSPCAGPEMTPRMIARAARAAKLDLVAITDHNTAFHAPVFDAACRENRLHALFGLEATTAEGAHVLCLFDDSPAAVAFGQGVYDRLRSPPPDALPVGDSCMVNLEEEVVGAPEKYLGAETDIPVADLCVAVLRAGGLCIPSHVDRPMTGLAARLGGVPDLPFDAVEVSPAYDPRHDSARLRGRFAMIHSSDAHEVGSIGQRWMEIKKTGFTVDALRNALRNLRDLQSD